MKIEIGKYYKTNSGIRAKAIYKLNGPTEPWVIIVHYNGIDEVIIVDSNGINVDPEMSINEISPYEDFKIDDKVLVWDGTGLKNKRHFAGVNEIGKPMVWENGHTSWTTTFKTPWDHCEKADD